MRKVLAIAVLAALALAIAAGSARATAIQPTTPVLIRMADWTNLYDANGIPIPEGPGGLTIPAAGDESRSLLGITSLQIGKLINPPGILPDVLVASPPQTIPGGNSQLRGMVYDITVEAAPDAFGNVTFQPGGRYADDATGTTGSWSDQYVGQVQATTAGGYGGLVVLYEVDPDDAPSMSLDPDGDVVPDGPAQWAAGGAATDDPSLGGNPATVALEGVMDLFPTVSVVEPWLVAVLTPMPPAFLGESPDWGTITLTPNTVSNAALECRQRITHSTTRMNRGPRSMGLGN